MNWTTQPEVVFSASPIMPVMVIDDADDAVPMAQALHTGGISVFEITLRTPAALEAIRRISEAMPKALVGAGTVINPEQYDAAVAAGAQFVISPGATRELLEHAKQGKAPLIPGCATPSDVMQALACGYNHVKFFPAEANGGVKALSAIAAPLSQVKFCPTGGINPANIKDYLALDCVSVAGGSWMLPVALIRDKQWAEIKALAHSAINLVNV